jgi:hypothetical protein
METVSDLIVRARAYQKRTGAAWSTVSRKLLGDGVALGKLEKGQRSIQVNTLEKAFSRLREMERLTATDSEAA